MTEHEAFVQADGKMIESGRAMVVRRTGRFFISIMSEISKFKSVEQNSLWGFPP